MNTSLDSLFAQLQEMASGCHVELTTADARKREEAPASEAILPAIPQLPAPSTLRVLKARPEGFGSFQYGPSKGTLE